MTAKLKLTKNQVINKAKFLFYSYYSLLWITKTGTHTKIILGKKKMQIVTTNVIQGKAHDNGDHITNKIPDFHSNHNR